MDKIRIDIFDILGYIIPGTALLMILWIAADSQIKSVWHIYESLKGVHEKAIYAGLILSYFLGFILHILGSFLYDNYQKWKGKIAPKNETLTTPEKWALIRENGEKHVYILERWYALRAFSQNLAAMALICVLISIYKFFAFGYYEWLFISLVFCISFFIFLKRADTFHTVLNKDIAAVLKKLNLEPI